MKRYLQSLFLFFLFHSIAHAQAPLPAAVNTDPAKAQVVLPEPANPALPSLVLIGDSTVRNGHDDGQGKGPTGQWGWGNPIANYFDTSKVNVVNRAVGGLSSRTYITSGHWQRTLALIKKGDVVLMQFGHNDASPVNDTSRARGTIRGTGNEAEEIDNLLTKKRETVHSYGWYLADYVAQVRAKGATPVIVSPISRVRSANWTSDERSVACACASRPFAALLPSGSSNEIDAVTNGSHRPDSERHQPRGW
jgi:lysophospholipase L1-like esterase